MISVSLQCENLHTILYNPFLVSTYVVCERLSVMHEPAGVVEILVQILQFTPILPQNNPPNDAHVKIVT